MNTRILTGPEPSDDKNKAITPTGTASLLAELRGGDAKPDAPQGVAVAAPKARPRMSGQTLVLMLVVGVSAAALFTMRQASIRAGVRVDTVEVSYTPDGDSHKMAVNQKRMIDLLKQSGTPVQVPAENVQKNPFHLDQAEDAPATAKGDEPMDAAAKAAQEAKLKAESRQRELEAKINQLTLQSVLGGKSPIARINTWTVRVGDTVDETFKVVAIEGRSVLLEADGTRFILSMDDKKTNNPGSGPSRPR